MIFCFFELKKKKKKKEKLKEIYFKLYIMPKIRNMLTFEIFALCYSADRKG
jgi:hypothetical protein